MKNIYTPMKVIKNKLSDEKEGSPFKQLQNKIILRKIEYHDRQELSGQLDVLRKCIIENPEENPLMKKYLIL